MSQPVKLSDALVLDARIAAKAQQRSIAGQVEFWASLGKSVELLLNGKQAQALRGTDAAHRLVEAIETVESPEGRARVAGVLARRPFPHFRQAPGQPDLLVRIDEDGTETVGRFISRKFVAAEKPNPLPVSAAHETAAGIGARAQRKKAETEHTETAERAPSAPRTDGKRPWA
jgi:hypothetical protein